MATEVMTIADTDVLIDFLSASEPTAGRVRRELQHGNLATTVITRFELLSGARSARALRAIGQLMDSIRTMELDNAAADRAAAVRRMLERKGSEIGMADSLIAGIVLHVSGILLTRNRRHFERVEGLTLAAL
jgi:tRNA(fMet)-specific endonuclease VapC